MIISCHLFFICGNYLHSTLWSMVNYHLFLPRCMLHAEVTDLELCFAHKMHLQTQQQCSSQLPMLPSFLSWTSTDQYREIHYDIGQKVGLTD